MMSVTFVRGETTVTLPDPTPGGAVRRERRQAVGRTAGGTVFVYEKGAATLQAELKFELLTDLEKEALQGFFDSEACGAKNTFTYTDSAGTAWTARFVEAALRLVKVCGNVWDAGVVMELESGE
jgi:hypothetical protein